MCAFSPAPQQHEKPSPRLCIRYTAALSLRRALVVCRGRDVEQMSVRGTHPPPAHPHRLQSHPGITIITARSRTTVWFPYPPQRSVRGRARAATRPVLGDSVHSVVSADPPAPPRPRSRVFSPKLFFATRWSRPMALHPMLEASSKPLQTRRPAGKSRQSHCLSCFAKAIMCARKRLLESLPPAPMRDIRVPMLPTGELGRGWRCLAIPNRGGQGRVGMGNGSRCAFCAESWTVRIAHPETTRGALWQPHKYTTPPSPCPTPHLCDHPQHL